MMVIERVTDCIVLAYSNAEAPQICADHVELG